MNPEKPATYYSLVKDKFSPIRTEAMLDALGRGLSGPDQLEKESRKRNLELTDEMGSESDKVFDDYAINTGIVKSVRNASPTNDVYNAIDKWVDFYPITRLPSLPVQVKSSKARVEKFRKSYKYSDLNEMVIVINCGPKSDENTFQRDFNTEINRIRKIINSDSNSFKIR